MKIAVIVRSLKYGGMERAACNQADAFFLAGHKADLIYFSNKEKQIAPRQKDVKVIHLDLNTIMKNSLLGRAWDIFARITNIIFRKTYPLIKGFYTSKIFKEEFEKLEKDEKYDLILIRGQGTFEQVWQFKDARSVRISVNVSTKKRSNIINKIISRAYFQNVHLNCNSEGGAYYFEEKLKKENVKPLSLKAIRNPFFKEKVFELSNEYNKEIPNEPFILGVGRLVKAKNFELLIDTFISLKNNDDFKYKLVLVGHGSEKEILQEKVKQNNLEDEVIFVGYQKNPYNWMKKSEAFVLTSKFEGLCGVLIEAMCCKTRIIATKSPGGVKELMSGVKMKDNLVDPEPDILAKRILKVLKDDKEYYFNDYSNILETLEPNYVVNKWLEYKNNYTFKDKNDK